VRTGAADGALDRVGSTAALSALCEADSPGVAGCGVFETAGDFSDAIDSAIAAIGEVPTSVCESESSGAGALLAAAIGPFSAVAGAPCSAALALGVGAANGDIPTIVLESAFLGDETCGTADEGAPSAGLAASGAAITSVPRRLAEALFDGPAALDAGAGALDGTAPCTMVFERFAAGAPMRPADEGPGETGGCAGALGSSASVLEPTRSLLLSLAAFTSSLGEKTIVAVAGRSLLDAVDAPRTTEP
jgi:hypothetical protein